jgi:hypothetical protein
LLLGDEHILFAALIWLLISDWTPAIFGDLRRRGGGDSTENSSYLLAELASVPSQISAECVFDKAIYF